MKTLAILYICTGPYAVFWHDFYPNFKANFLPDCDRTFYVFTDAAHIDYEDAPDVRRIYQKALPWPQSTMLRFDAFLGQADALQGYDYLFFANANLHCTRVIRADELLPDPAAGQSLTAVCAVAVCRAVEKVCGRAPGIKWINDLYLRGKKICGILCESSVRDGRVDYAVLGIGLNVTTRIEDFPEELRETAGSLLTQTGFVFERGKLIAAIIAELSSLYTAWLEAPSVCHAEYKRRCIVLDRQISVSSPEGEYEAVAEGISPDYGLILRLDDGTRRTVHSGEVKIKM